MENNEAETILFNRERRDREFKDALRLWLYAPTSGDEHNIAASRTRSVERSEPVLPR